MKLSIVIPVFNKINFTKSCLNDLLKLPKDHEIIMVNNGSSDGTVEYLSETQKQHSNLLVINNKDNLGFAKACNIGFAAATAPNIMFLNNDIRVKSNHEDWTKEIIEKCANGLVGPTMGQLDKNLNFMRESNSPIKGKYTYMSGWCVASSKDIWEKLKMKNYIGPFSEEFGLAYFEDTDMGGRCRQLGIEMKIIQIPVVHFGKQTSQQLNTYALYKSAREIFIKKWKNQNY